MGHPSITNIMDKNIKKIISITGGVIATGAVVAGMIFITNVKRITRDYCPPVANLYNQLTF